MERVNTQKKWLLEKYVSYFFIYSFFGWVIEVILFLFQTKDFVNRGFLHLPILPIYGFGGVLILVLLKPFRKKQLYLFITGIILAGILEYSTSWFLETFKGMKWWDYTGYFLNLNGRICLEGLK